jgi:hypothetical protein
VYSERVNKKLVKQKPGRNKTTGLFLSRKKEGEMENNNVMHMAHLLKILLAIVHIIVARAGKTEKKNRR